MDTTVILAIAITAMTFGFIGFALAVRSQQRLNVLERKLEELDAILKELAP